jgi:hypothetical protein
VATKPQAAPQNTALAGRQPLLISRAAMSAPMYAAVKKKRSVATKKRQLFTFTPS